MRDLRDGNESESGGGNDVQGPSDTPSPSSPPPPAAAKPSVSAKSVDPERYASVVAQNAALKAQLKTLQRQIDDVKQKAAKAAEARRKEIETKAAEANEREARAWQAAKTAQLKAHLQGLKKPDYLRLAPDIELTEDGLDLTEQSKKALEQFRQDHPDLFNRTPGTTPVSGAGPKWRHGYDQNVMNVFRSWGQTPEQVLKAHENSPFARVQGFEAPRLLNIDNDGVQ